MTKKIIKKINSEPRKLFLIDGFGAIVSAFLLGVVLVKWEEIFGIPPSTLYFLAFLPCLFAIYDFYCYQKDSKNLGIFLKAIATMNLLYCCLSIGLAFYHHHTITLFGWVYILNEILIIITLVYFEFKAAKLLTSKIENG